MMFCCVCMRVLDTDDNGGIRHAMHDNPIDSPDMRSDDDN